MNCLICTKNAVWEETSSGKKFCSKECQMIGNEYTKLGRDPQMLILLNLTLIELDEICMINKKTAEICESKDFMIFYITNRPDFIYVLLSIYYEVEKYVIKTNSLTLDNNDYYRSGDYLLQLKKKYGVGKMDLKKKTYLDFEQYWKTTSKFDRIFLKWVPLAINFNLFKRTSQTESYCFALIYVFSKLKFKVSEKVKTQIFQILGKSKIITLFTQTFSKPSSMIGKKEIKFVSTYIKTASELGYLYPEQICLIAQNSQFELFETCLPFFDVIPKLLLVHVMKNMSEKEFVMVINHRNYVEDPLLISTLYYRISKKSKYIMKYTKNVSLPDYQKFIDFMVENNDADLAELIYNDTTEFRPKNISKTFHDCVLKIFQAKSELGRLHKVFKFIYLKFKDYLTNEEIERYEIMQKSPYLKNIYMEYIENIEKDKDFTYYEHLESVRAAFDRFLTNE